MSITDTPRLLVQTATSLAADDWLTVPWRVQQCDDLVGSLGSATFAMRYGDIIDSQVGYEERREAPSMDDLEGILVRVLVEDEYGVITLQNDPDRAWTDSWYGKIKAVEQDPTGAGGGMVRIEAVELGALFRDIAITTGAERLADGSGGWPTRHVRRFNAIAGGDRSAAKYLVSGATVYIHDLTATVTGNQWTALDVLETLIGVNWPTSAIGLTVSDPDGALAYIPPAFDADGRTLYDVIDGLCSANRGLVWWVEVSGPDLVIQVRSTTAADITVDTYTLPANTLTETMVVDALTAGLSITTVADDVTDEIEIVGGRPAVIVTLNLKSTSTSAIVPDTNSSLRQGWSSAAGTAWDAWDADPRSDLPPTTADGAWTRYEINPAWKGAQAPSIAGAAASNGLRNVPTIETSASYGEGGETGETTYDDLEPVPSAWSLTALHDLPASLGWGTLRLGARQPAVIVIGTGTTWIDMSSSWKLSMEDSPPAIRIDDGEGGAAIRARLLEGFRLYVTVALEEWEPMIVSWRRPVADRPLSALRRRRNTFPQLGQSLLLAGTVLGVNSDTGYGTDVVRQADDLLIRDDLPIMRRLLAYSRGWYESSAAIATWTDRASWGISSTRRPGAILVSVDDGDQTHAIAAVITGRSRRVVYVNGVAVLETGYRSDVIMPDLEAVI